MGMSKDFVEERKYKRFRPRDGIIVIPKGSGKMLGQAINISRGGLAFRYIIQNYALAEA